MAQIKHFEKISQHIFLKDDTGTTHFYPLGRFAKGYKLEDEKQYSACRTLSWQAYLATMLITACVGAVISIQLQPIILGLCLGLYWMQQHKLTQKLEPSNLQDILFCEYLESVKQKGFVKIVANILISFGIIITGCSALGEEPLVATAIIVIGMLSMGVFGFAMLLKIKEMRDLARASEEASEAASNDENSKQQDEALSEDNLNKSESAEEPSSIPDETMNDASLEPEKDSNLEKPDD